MIQAIGFALRYLPLIVAAVQFVQNFVKATTSGPEKQALAVNFVVSTLDGMNVKVTERTVEIIKSLINLTVTVLNAFGIFTSDKGENEAAIVIASEVAIETKVKEVGLTESRLDELETLLTPR